MARTARIYFAGGTKGPNARADGKGGLYSRGWYITAERGGARFGPFRTLTEAKQHPQGAFASVEAKHTRADADAAQVSA